MNIRRRSSVFVFYIIACNTAIWRYENKRVNLFWRDEESQPFQRKYASYELLPELATISWIACLLASAEGPVLHSLSPCQSSQVNWPQTLRGNYCTCSWSLSSINGEKMTSCARVYWICHFNSWISYPRLCFIAFQMKFNYPVPSHFQFSGRDGSGTWKKVRDGSGTGIPSDPGVCLCMLLSVSVCVVVCECCRLGYEEICWKKSRIISLSCFSPPWALSNSIVVCLWFHFIEYKKFLKKIKISSGAPFK